MGSDLTAKELEQCLQKSENIAMLKKSKLGQYIVSSLLSDDLPSFRALVPHEPYNYGLLMRWTLALHTMEAYYADVPAEDRIQIMTSWTRKVRSLIDIKGPPWIKCLE